MMSIRNDMEPNLQWIIGRGEIDISLDKWINFRVPTMSLRAPVKSLFMTNRLLNVPMVSRLLSNGLCDKIR